MTTPPLNSTPVSAAADVLGAVLFLVAISAPGAVHLFTPDDPSAVASENRVPAPAPGRPGTWDELATFPARFEAYFDDAFRFRTALVRAHNMVKLFLLKTSPSEEFLVGEDGWLFCTVNETMEQHRGLLPLSEPELDDMLLSIRRRAEWLESLGSTYTVLIAPDKSSIYADHLPAWLREPPLGPVPLDQLVGRALERREPSLVDVRGTLLGRRSDDLLYYPYGSHWNPLGAYHAYRALFERLAQTDSRLAPLSLDRFDVTPILDVADSWGLRTHLEDVLIQPSFRLDLVDDLAVRSGPRGWKPNLQHVWEHPDSTLPTAIVFADSFGDNILPFIRLHFSRTLQIRGYSFDTDVVRVFRPDHVIQVVVERCFRDSVFRTQEIEAAWFRPGLADDRPTAAYAGEYRNPILGPVQVTAHGDGLVAHYRDLELTLKKDGPHLFAVTDHANPMSVVFDRDAAGGPMMLTAITPHNMGVMAFARETGTARTTSGDAAVVGTYESQGERWEVASTGADLILFTQRGDYLGTLVRVDSGSYEIRRLRSIGEVRFGPTSANPLWMDLEFEGPVFARATRVPEKSR